MVVAKWDGALDLQRARAVLDGRGQDTPEPREARDRLEAVPSAR
jgi:hypothetical protein